MHQPYPSTIWNYFPNCGNFKFQINSSLHAFHFMDSTFVRETNSNYFPNAMKLGNNTRRKNVSGSCTDWAINCTKFATKNQWKWISYYSLQIRKYNIALNFTVFSLLTPFDSTTSFSLFSILAHSFTLGVEKGNFMLINWIFIVRLIRVNFVLCFFLQLDNNYITREGK